MKIILILVTLLLFSCSTSDPCEKISSTDAENLIHAYFTAITTSNFDELKRLSTPNYVLYENGAIWNNDSLIHLIESMPGAKIVYDLGNFKVQPDCNGSFITYSNHGLLTMADCTKVDYNWLESAYVKKMGDELKLDFLHSTVAK